MVLVTQYTKLQCLQFKTFFEFKEKKTWEMLLLGAYSCLRYETQFFYL